MTRVINVDAIYRTKDIHKNLKKFVKRFPEASAYCEFDKDATLDDIKKSLPITDKYFADGTINENWTYYFDIDIDENEMYMWFIVRA